MVVEFAFIAHFFNRGVSIRVPLITWCIYDVIALVFLINLKDLKRRAGSGHGARVAYWIFVVYTIGFGFPLGSTTKVKKTRFMIYCILYSISYSKTPFLSDRFRIFQRGGANQREGDANKLHEIIIAKYCMKMKKNGLRWGRVPHALFMSNWNFFATVV